MSLVNTPLVYTPELDPLLDYGKKKVAHLGHSSADIKYIS